jgi:hypothetical protein
LSPYRISIPLFRSSFFIRDEFLHYATSSQTWWSTTYVPLINLSVLILIYFLAKPSKPVPGKGNGKNASSAPSALPAPTRTVKGGKPSASNAATRHDDKDDDNEANWAESQPRHQAQYAFNLYMDGPPGLTSDNDDNSDDDNNDDDDGDDDDDDNFDGMPCLPLATRCC